MNDSEERYRSLFNSIDEGFCIIELLFDAHGTPVDYLFLELNPAFEHQTGIVGALGRRMRDLIPEHEQKWFDVYGRVATTGEAIRFENYSSVLDRWFSLYAFRVGEPEQHHVAVIFTDITAIKAEKIRAEFLARLSMELATTSTEVDIIRRATEATGRHFQADRCYFVEWREEEDRVRVSHNWVRDHLPSLEGEYSLFDFGGLEWWNRYASGSFAVNDVTLDSLTCEKSENYAAIGIRSYAVQPFRHEGERKAVLAVADAEPRVWTSTELSLLEDVVARVWPLVERARVEQALRGALAEAARASRAKDDFLAALSHELRTPLTPVLMTVSALEMEPGLDPDLREQIALVRRNVQLEARLIDDLLDLTRITHGKLQLLRSRVDIHRLLGQTEAIARADGLGKNVRVEYALCASHHVVMADGTRLQQVLWNLLKNALKFTPAGGKVTIATADASEGKVAVTFTDTGVGIRADLLPHVFNAFEQGDARGQHRYGGLGLGLAISRAIVQAHGGTLAVASAGVGAGATFTLVLAAVD